VVSGQWLVARGQEERGTRRKGDGETGYAEARITRSKRGEPKRKAGIEPPAAAGRLRTRRARSSGFGEIAAPNVLGFEQEGAEETEETGEPGDRLLRAGARGQRTGREEAAEETEATDISRDKICGG
jgi:hypothetical protein